MEYKIERIYFFFFFFFKFSSCGSSSSSRKTKQKGLPSCNTEDDFLKYIVNKSAALREETDTAIQHPASPKISLIKRKLKETTDSGNSLPHLLMVLQETKTGGKKSKFQHPITADIIGVFFFFFSLNRIGLIFSILIYFFFFFLVTRRVFSRTNSLPTITIFYY